MNWKSGQRSDQIQVAGSDRSLALIQEYHYQAWLAACLI